MVGSLGGLDSGTIKLLKNTHIMTDRCGILACVLLAVLFFGDAFYGDRTLVPAGDLYRLDPWKSIAESPRHEPAQCFDQLFQFYPWADFFRQSIHSGKFPLWNPYNYLGTPFFANPQTALLFPLSWLHVIFPLRYSFTLLFLIKLAAVLLGMFAWLRSRRLPPEAALLGAVIFGLSMHTVVSLPYPYSNVTTVFPWALLAVSKLMEKVTTKRFVAVTAALTLTIVAGQPQSALVAFLAIGVLILVESWGRFRQNAGSLISVATALSLSVAISAVQWLTSLAYVNESMVTDGPRIVRSTYPYALGPFLNLLVPNFFGTPEAFWGFPGYPDTAFYSSIVAVFLAFLALSRRVPLRDLALLGILLLITLGVLFGLPPFEFLLDLPGLNLVRRNKFVVLLVFVLAELAARGSTQIAAIPRRQRLLKVIAVCFLLASLGSFGLWSFRDFLRQLDPAGTSLWNAGRSGVILLIAAGIVLLTAKKWRPTAIVVLVLLDVGALSYRLHPRGNASNLYPKVGVEPLLTGNPPRIYALDGTFFPNTAQFYQLQDVRGYDVITPRRLFRFMQAIDPKLGNAYNSFIAINPSSIHAYTLMRRTIGAALEKYGPELADYCKSNDYWSVGVSDIARPELFDVLHIKYVFGCHDKVPPHYRPMKTSLSTQQIFVRPVDHQFAAFESWVSAEEQAVIRTMSGVDLDRVVVVESASIPRCRHVDGLRPSRAKLLYRTTESASYEIDAPQSTVLVEFERYSSGWKAFLNGEEIEVSPADYIFRGVHIPAGKHRVDFRYRPAALTWGLMLSLIGIIAGIGISCVVPRFNAWNQP